MTQSAGWILLPFVRMVANSMCADGKRHRSRCAGRKMHCLFTSPAGFSEELTMKAFLVRLGRLAENVYLQAFVAAVVVVTSFRESWETVAEDVSGGRLRASHGTLLLGVTIFLQSLPAMVRGLEAMGKVAKEEVAREIRKLEDRSK